MEFKIPIKYGGEFFPANTPFKVARKDVRSMVAQGAELICLKELGSSIHNNAYLNVLDELTRAQLLEIMVVLGYDVIGRPSKRILKRHIRELS